MDRNRHFTELLDEVLSGRLSRRDMLRRALALGLSIPAIGALLAACGDDDDDDGATATSGGAGGASPTAAAATPTTAAATPTESGGAASPTGEAEATPTESTAGASPTTGGSPTTGDSSTWARDNPPDVWNVATASEYTGTKIVFWGDAVGGGSEADTYAAAKFTEQTGIEVEVIPRPQSATESYSQYLRTFQGQSSDMDCGMIDVIWPGALAPHLLDLSDAFADLVDQYYPGVIENNTIDGKLVAIPWFGDYGMLYYRTDLLEKYDIAAPPETWDELEEQARTIMEGERGANAEFWGFVFQGNAYEGLTCDALEWIASHGGGLFVENGEVTVDNDNAKAALNRARDWVGDIAPDGVTSYQEEEARNVFQAGNSAFMRNWPYAYANGQQADSPIKDLFDVTKLPAQEGNDHVGTVGGWQIAVSNYSENKEAAIEWVKYITSPDFMKWRALFYTFVPMIEAVANDPEVKEILPFLAGVEGLVPVTRPSRETGELYNEVSTAIFQNINAILTGDDAEDVVPDMAQEIEDILAGG
jgi:trehalose/maltose transport system substrate-binding protein